MPQHSRNSMQQTISPAVEQLFAKRAALERLVLNGERMEYFNAVDIFALKIAGSRIDLALSEDDPDVLHRTRSAFH